MYAVRIDILKGEIESFFKINKYSVIYKGDIITDDFSSIDISYFANSIKPKYDTLMHDIDNLIEKLSKEIPEKRDLFDQILFSK